MSKPGFTYIISNYQRTVIYTGVTNNIYRRMYEYKNNIGSIFASRYKCRYLLYYESFQHIADAIAREKQFKRWHKDWKWNQIKSNNPELIDVSIDWFNEKNELKEPGLAIQHLRGF